MSQMTGRREFLRRASLPAAAAFLFRDPAPAAARKMKICLHTGNIGVKANLRQQFEYAVRYGFEAYDPNINELAALSDSDLKRLLDEMAAKNIVFGSLAQSVPVTQPEEKFSEWLKNNLTGWAKTLQRAGMTRFCTWISPGDNRLTYLQNFRLHAKRLGEVATVLGDHGIRFGLEYVGPRTSWSRSMYPFIHTMASMKELIAEINKPNLGFLLDSWHWHNSQETPEDILTLTNKDIVAVHVNDAPKDVPLDQLRDGQREIPLATGVINISGFINALHKTGFDGPVAAEPLGAPVRNLPPEEALATVADAMKRMMALIQ
jgi:sugar phosphate isomerase/epimerase